MWRPGCVKGEEEMEIVLIWVDGKGADCRWRSWT
jgi:hypothetical protein